MTLRNTLKPPEVPRWRHWEREERKQHFRYYRNWKVTIFVYFPRICWVGMNSHTHAFQPPNLHSASWLSIQKCNKTYNNLEYISTASLGKFLCTVGKKTAALPGYISTTRSVECATFANWVLKTCTYACHIAEVFKCILCHTKLNKLLRVQRCSDSAQKLFFPQVLKMSYKQEVN